MKKSFVSILLAVILAASFIGVFFVMSIMDLTNKKDIHTVNITKAYSLLVIENSINGLIPIGKDYYYLGLCEETQKMYVIHGDKNWLDDNFDNNGSPLGSSEFLVTSLEKRVGDYDVEKELANRIAQVEGFDYGTDFGNALELDYIRSAILRLVAGVLLLIEAGIGFFFKKSKKEIPPAGKKVILCIVMITLFFSLKTII